MSQAVLPPDIAAHLRVISDRLAIAERAAIVRFYTTATRPAAAALKGAIIFNTTTLKHEGSNGTTWNALY